MTSPPRTSTRASTRHISVKEIEARIVKAAAHDPVTYIEYMIEKPLADHHKLWLAHMIAYPRLNLIAPRNSAKTTIMVYFLSWVIGRAPYLNHMLLCVSAEQSKTRLSMLKGIIADNPRYHNIFPVRLDENKPNTQTAFSVKRVDIPYSRWIQTLRSKGNEKEHTILSGSVGSKVVIGARVNGTVVFDDIIDHNYLTDNQMGQVENWMMQTVIPCLNENARAVNIGTRWMLDDIPERLKNNPAWHTVEIPAIIIINDPETGRDHKVSYWPSEWPLSRLEKTRLEMNNDQLFRVMYLNDPSAYTANNFSNLDRDLPATLPAFTDIYITTDLALSEKSSADWTVFQAVAIDKQDRLYILDQMRFRGIPEKSVRNLAVFVDRVRQAYGPIKSVLIEKVNFQPVMVSLLRTQRPDIPIRQVVPIGDKVHRANGVSLFDSQGKLFINQSMPDIKQLKQEWKNFPLHKHDDTLDPISLLVQHLYSRRQNATLKVVRSPLFI